MLAEMARHVLHGEAEFVILAQTRMGEVESRIAEAPVKRVVFVTEFPGSDGSRNFGEGFRVEPKRLAHFACRHAIAISDDVGGHGGATRAVFTVKILDYFLTLIAAGQIE